MCVDVPALSPSPPPGQRAEQARGCPAAHPEPVRNLPERQQERQRHTAGTLRGLVSGVLLAAPAEQNQRTWRQQPRWCAFTLGTRYPPPALWGGGDQKPQEKEA